MKNKFTESLCYAIFLLKMTIYDYAKYIYTAKNFAAI